jgi:RNA polymerase sigma factor (sigma-70 family)
MEGVSMSRNALAVIADDSFDPSDGADGFPITVTSRARNGVLWELAKKAGSQKALATQLGLRYHDMNALINMTRKINLASPKWKDAEAKLLLLYGLDWSQAAPAAVMSDDFLSIPKRIEKTKRVPMSSLSIADRSRHSKPPDSEVIFAEQDAKMHAAIASLLKSLSYREQQVVRMRYGIDCDPLTLESTAAVMRVSRERIRQIESKAIRKLQMPRRSSRLIEFVE